MFFILKENKSRQFKNENFRPLTIFGNFLLLPASLYYDSQKFIGFFDNLKPDGKININKSSLTKLTLERDGEREIIREKVLLKWFKSYITLPLRVYVQENV